MPPKFKDGDVVVSVSGKWISWAHTITAYAAFLGALFTGLSLHYQKIVENEYYKYPEEWFPSVSATIGDRYPERAVFQLFIALTSGPRFALVILFYAMTARSDSVLPKLVLGTGLFRSLSCGGWTYVTSTDDHGRHDIFMVSYLVATIPWTLGCIALNPNNAKSLSYRKMLAGCFFGNLAPLTYFFLQHKIHKVAGAYTIYAFFEWAAVLFDVGFDAVTAIDFDSFELIVRDVKGVSRGNVPKVSSTEKEKALSVRKMFEQPGFWSETTDAAADAYCGFVFWSMLTSLALQVWYFPLWQLGLTGYEVVIMTTVSSSLLAVQPFRTLVMKNLRYFHLLSLSGLLAYLVQSPATRLMGVAFGVGMTCLAWPATWYADRLQPIRLEKRIMSWSLGLIASSVAKFAFKTNNPIWPVLHAENGGWNKAGIAVAVLAILRATRRVNSSGGSLDNGSQPRSSVLAGIGFGGLLFGLHTLLADSSTMISWVWEGFPVRGPIAAHGVLVIAAMGVGLYLDDIYPKASSVRTKYGLLVVGTAMVTYFSHWTGFVGALLAAMQLMSLSTTIIGSAARASPALTFGLGFLVYNILVLAHIWTVGYAFVPGGPLLRESTDRVMAAMVVCVGAGVLSSPRPKKNAKAKPKKPFSIAYQLKSYGFSTLMVLQVLAIATSYLRFPTNDYVPYHKEDKVLTAGIWCIHFYLDNDMWSSEHRMRDVIKELELDVFGLLESDSQRILMGNRDGTQFLAEELGMYVDYGPGPNKHTWGAALLSKFPILNSTHHLLPSPVGELAPAIHATLDAYGELVDVIVFHSGQEEDVEDRRQQSEYLAKLMKESPRPTILLSYLVTKPLEGNYNTYVGEKSGMRDIDSTDWDRWCEYILYKNIRRIGYARVSRSTITDTEIQVGKFAVGRLEGSDNQVPEDQVPEGYRFPALFRGAGVRGHAYHVFDEPRYYS